MRYLAVKNFKKHQHYTNRRPPWIKLHVEVLDDYAFACLQDASKAHLMLLWVLASKMDNRIPYDLVFLSQKLGATSPLDVEELVAQGFIEVSEDDSKALAPRKQSAMPETEREAEAEKENNSGASAPSSGRPPRATAVHPDAERVLAHHLEIHPRQRPDRRAVLRLITRRLATYTAEELIAASDGNARDSWASTSGNQGIDFVLKNNAAVDKWRALAAPRSPVLAVLPQSRGRVLLDLFRRYDLFAYNGNQDEYVAKRAKAAADPAAGPDFIAECSAVKPWKDLPGDNDHFKAQEIEKRLAARGTATTARAS